MPSTILSDNGASSGTAGLKNTGSNDGQLVLQTTTAGGTATTAMTINTSQAVTFAQTANLPNTFGFKNRIINGAMVIDQRNAGASITPVDSQYTVDRWQCFLTQASKFTADQNAASVTPPAGFLNYLGFTSSSAYTVLTSDYFGFQQHIEYANTYDLDWGTANAKTVTLSFWVRSSLTGTFGGALANYGRTRAYPFTYTISVANTWEQKSITIAGDTSGTWGGAINTGGITVGFGLGVGSTYSTTAGAWATGLYLSATGATSVVGTNGATLYITGVQLETGSTATSFDYRDYGRELIMCQRYYYKIKAETTNTSFSMAQCDSTTTALGTLSFPVTMRTRPTALEQSGTAGNYRISHSGTTTTCSAVPSYSSSTSSYAGQTVYTVASGLTLGRAAELLAASTDAYLAWSAEL